MLRKIRKLLLHPNLYFYDYFRKKLGFKKYFVTDKIRLLDAGNHQKWHRLIFSHPYLYFYYKFRKRLHKPAYPILVDYRIDTQENVMGGGKRTVLAVELERHNIIYFADPAIVQKAIDNLDPYLAGKISTFTFQGNGNTVFLDTKVRLGRHAKISVAGDNNYLNFEEGTTISDGVIDFYGDMNLCSIGKCCLLGLNTNFIFNGDRNTLITKNNVSFKVGTKIIFQNNNNLAYFGEETKILTSSTFDFKSDSALMYISGQCAFQSSSISFRTNTILFFGYGCSINPNFVCSLLEAKNVIIGSDCMFSHQIHLRNATSHAIYEGSSKKRIARGQSIIIGEHVWFGFGVKVVKGVNIGKGSMIGAYSVVSKDIPDECMAAGNPAEVRKGNILWTRAGPGEGSEEKFAEFEIYREPIKKITPIGWDRLLMIDGILSSISTKDKLKQIQRILND